MYLANFNFSFNKLQEIWGHGLSPPSLTQVGCLLSGRNTKYKNTKIQKYFKKTLRNMGAGTVSASSDAAGGFVARSERLRETLASHSSSARADAVMSLSDFFSSLPVRDTKKWCNCKLIRILDTVSCFLLSAGNVPSSHVIGWSSSSGDKWKSPFSIISCHSPLHGLTSCHILTTVTLIELTNWWHVSADCNKIFPVRTEQLWHNDIWIYYFWTSCQSKKQQHIEPIVYIKNKFSNQRCNSEAQKFTSILNKYWTVS